MRVAYICADPGVPVFGHKGCSIHVQEVIRGMSRLGAEVELFATRIGGIPATDLKDIVVHRLPRCQGRGVADREKACIAANRPLRQSLERSNSFDLIYERYSLWSYAGLEYARGAGRPGLLEVNAPLIEESRDHRSLSDEVQALRLTRRAFSSASHIITVSKELSPYVQSLGEAPQKIHVVPNGVNLERFSPIRGPATDNTTGFTVGFSGSLKPWHDLPTLLAGFGRLWEGEERCRLLIVGDGPETAWLSRELADTPLSGAVTLEGAVPPAQVPAFLQQMDVGIVPCPALANFYFSPLKIFEYMATGLPVIASRIGQPGRLIEDEVNGLLYAPGDANELSECLLRLKENERLRVRLGKAAQRTAVNEHSWDRRVNRIFRISGVDAPSAVGVN